MLCYKCLQKIPDRSTKCPNCGQMFSLGAEPPSGAPAGAPPAAKPPAGAPPETFVVGDVIADRFEVREVVGLGAVGTVFKVKDLKGKGVVAFKRLHPSLGSDPELRRRFPLRMQSARDRRHANVVEVLEWGEDAGVPFVVMEFLEGLSLRRLLQVRSEGGNLFTAEEAEPVMEHLCAALGVLHRKAPHLDVKPENVLILSESLKLTDVETARILPLKDFVSLQLAQGDVYYYIAPEVIQEGRGDARSDVFSLGAILYEMFSGSIPKGTYQSVREKNPSLPPRVDGFLEKALASDPAVRWRSMHAFFTGFLEALGKDVLDVPAGIPDEEPAPFLEEPPPPPPAAPPVPPPAPPVPPAAPSPPSAKPSLEHLLEEPGPSASEAAPSRPSEPARRSLLVPGMIAAAVLAAGAGGYWLYSRLQETQQQQRALIQRLAEEKRQQEAESKRLAEVARQRAAETEKLEAEKKQAVEEAKRMAEEEAKRKAEEERRRSESGRKRAAGMAKPPPARCPSDMAFVPAGPFLMGSAPDDSARNPSEKTNVSVEVGDFCIDLYEYPNRKGGLPMVQVTWAEAARRCKAEGKRLCTEEEWEKACKGPQNLRYPYGNVWDANRCDTKDSRDQARRIAASGAFSECRSGYGVYDMSGDVREWTSSFFKSGLGDLVQRGGSYSKPDWAVRCASRDNDLPTARSAECGFRCCKTP